MPLRETTEKVDFKFYDNATLSYHEKKTYEFIPEMSAYPESAKVFVPNIPFMVSAGAPSSSGHRAPPRPATSLYDQLICGLCLIWRG